MPGIGFISPEISSNPLRIWLVLHILFAKPVKISAGTGYMVLASVKDYSPAVNPFSTKKQSELEKNQFRDFYCLGLIYL